MAKFNFRYRRGVNIPRVVGKVAGTILALYVGGTIITEIGNVMVNTTSPFYKGLALIGWTLGSTQLSDGTYYACSSSGTAVTNVTSLDPNCITSTSGSGILAVIGIVGIASIVMEFVEVRMR